MSTQGYEYQKVRELLMVQMRRCRDKDIRIKVDLLLYGLKLKNIEEACRVKGFGKTFFYKWWKRLVKGKFKLAALSEKSRRPKRSPKKISLKVEKRILSLRAKGFGPKTLRHYLLREGVRVSESVIHHVICRRQPAVKKKVFKLKKHRKRYELPVPGQRLQMDVKYSPMLVGGETVYIYVAIDESTRWRYAKAYRALNDHWTLDFLSGIKRAFPFPIHCIQTDNGPEFTYRLLTGKEETSHLMQRWCRENKIPHVFIPPGVKELNGKVERSHRIDAEYFYGNAPTSNIEAFNKALERWIKRYNTERLHGGLGFTTPLEKLHERLAALAGAKLSGDAEKKRVIFCNSVKIVKEVKKEDKIAA